MLLKLVGGFTSRAAFFGAIQAEPRATSRPGLQLRMAAGDWRWGGGDERPWRTAAGSAPIAGLHFTLWDCSIAARWNSEMAMERMEHAGPWTARTKTSAAPVGGEQSLQMNGLQKIVPEKAM